MNLWSLLPTLAVCGLLSILGLLVAVKNSASRLNRVFAGASFAAVGWVLTNYFSSFHYVPYALAKLLTYGTMTTAGLFLLLLTAFCILFTTTPTPKRNKVLVIVTVVGILCSALGGTPLVIGGISAKGQFWVNSFAALSPIYFLYVLAYFLILIVVLIIGFRRSRAIQRVRVRLLLASLFVTIGISVLTNLIAPILSKNFSLVPYGPFSIIFMIGGFSYAIVKHRLFDIRLIVARSLAYVLLLGTLGGIYSLGLFGISDVLLGGNSIKIEQLAINMGLSLVLVFTFQPLRRFFEKLTDRIFFRNKYDSQELLNQITQTLAQEIDLGTILDKTITMICQAVRVNFGQYMIFEEGKVYKVEHYGKTPEQLISTTELKALNRSMLVADELEAGQRKDVMDKHGVRLSLVLRTKDEFVGFLLLGDKLSGDIYSTQDIELFEILANELAVAIVNAKAYEEIAQFNITLQDKVNQATARLRTANKHLKELDEAKDEFISMASHQLRTPLTTIKGYISMLQEGDAGKVTKEQNEFLEYAYDGSERMVGLISDLLNVSRMNSGKFMIDRTDIDPVAMVSDEVRQLVSHAEAKKLKLIWTPPKAKIPHVQLDDNKTRQVIMNFIDNAIYYTKEGSVTVTLAQKGDSIELRVTDTGIGVPKEAQDKLFSKFFRAGNAQQVRPDGTGLGLYLAKRVVEDQGGSIIFETTEGKGSTFGFLLPMKAPADKTPTTKPADKQSTNPTAVVASAKAATKVAVGT